MQGLAQPQVHIPVRRKLLVLDVNGVLCLRGKERTTITTRPGLQEFLRFCFINFHVAIWSSMQNHNLQRILQKILTPKEWGSLSFVYSQAETHKIQNKEKGQKPLLLKPLSALPPKYAQSDIILIDDSAYKCVMNTFFSSVFVDSFEGGLDDTFLLHSLVPFLRDLLPFTSVVVGVESRYPSWSTMNLLRDYRNNSKIWDQLDRDELLSESHSKHYRYS